MSMIYALFADNSEKIFQIFSPSLLTRGTHSAIM